MINITIRSTLTPAHNTYHSAEDTQKNNHFLFYELINAVVFCWVQSAELLNVGTGEDWSSRCRLRQQLESRRLRSAMKWKWLFVNNSELKGPITTRRNIRKRADFRHIYWLFVGSKLKTNDNSVEYVSCLCILMTSCLVLMIREPDFLTQLSRLALLAHFAVDYPSLSTKWYLPYAGCHSVYFRPTRRRSSVR
jgi:hypothetical protein